MRASHIVVLCALVGLALASKNSCKPRKWSKIGDDDWFPGRPNGGLGSPFVTDVKTKSNYNVEVGFDGFPVEVRFDGHASEPAGKGDYCVDMCPLVKCQYWTEEDADDAEMKVEWLPACGDTKDVEKYLECITPVTDKKGKVKRREYCADCKSKLKDALGGDIDLVLDDAATDNFYGEPEDWVETVYKPELYELAAEKAAIREGIPLEAARSLLAASARKLNALTSVSISIAGIEVDFQDMLTAGSLTLKLDPDTTTTFVHASDSRGVYTFQTNMFLCVDGGTTSCVVGLAFNDAVQSSKAEYWTVQSCDVADHPDGFDPSSQQISFVQRRVEKGTHNLHLAVACDDTVQVQPLPGYETASIIVT